MKKSMRLSRVGSVFASTVTLTVLGALVTPASADSETINGIPPVPEGYARMADTPEAKAVEKQNAARIRVFDLWAEKAELKSSGASSSALADLDARIAAADRKVEALTGQPLAAAAVSDSSQSTAAAAVPAAFPTPASAVTLSLTHSTQSQAWFCGPATTAMIIRMSGGSDTSKSGGDKMSQTMLSKAKYLATDRNDGTTMTRVPITLKKWMNLSTSVYYAPSATSIKNMTAGSIGVLRHGVAYGTHEGRNGPFYNNHNRGVDHYIAGYGYKGTGSTLKIADPVGGRAGWEKSSKTFTMSSSSMAGFVAQFGIIA